MNDGLSQMLERRNVRVEDMVDGRFCLPQTTHVLYTVCLSVYL